MSAHFCLAIALLDRTFHGRLDRGEPEWPPSPGRAYQALVAAAAMRAHGGPLPAAIKDALEWLERQPAPLIIAPEVSKATVAYRALVPNNAMDVVARAWIRGNYSNSGDASPAKHRAMKSICRTYLFGDHALYYIWPLAADEIAEAQPACAALSETARSILALGWGLDLAVGHGEIITADQLAHLPGERWMRVAPGGGATDLRIPCAGTLADLGARHRRFVARLGPEGLAPPPPFTAYRVVGYRRDFDPAPRDAVAFRLLDPASSSMRPFDPVRHTVTVAHMTRHAVGLAARYRWPDAAEVDRIVMGHGEPRDAATHQPPGNARFSFLPLPSVEYRGSGASVVGSIRRVMLSSSNPDFREPLEWARQAMPGRDLLSLGGTGEVIATLSGPQSDSVVQRFIDKAASWATVTPLVLPGYDDPDHYRRRLKEGVDAALQKNLLERLNARIDALLRKAIVQAGFPQALADHAALDWRGGGFFAGVDLASRYVVPDYLKRFPRLHVRITWRDGSGRRCQISGPICLGGGRFFGLGLFAGLPD